MKDYTMNSFEKKTFILYYDIDSLKQEITIYYADNTNETMPYSKNQEKIILQKMREQLLNAKDYIDILKEKIIKPLRNFSNLNKIVGTIYLSLVISNFIKYGLLTTLIYMLILSPLYIFSYKIYKRNKDLLSNAESLIDDYDKNFYFLNNEEVFSNKKVISPNVLKNASDKITHIINNGIITDEYADYQELSNDNSEVYVDHIITEDEEDIKELTMKGFKDYSQREIPFININTAGMLSQSELDNLKKQINQNDKPKVKVLSKIDR